MVIPLGSISPPPSVSKRSNASLISATSSSLSPGLTNLEGLNAAGLPIGAFLVAIRVIVLIEDMSPHKYLNKGIMNIEIIEYNRYQILIEYNR